MAAISHADLSAIALSSDGVHVDLGPSLGLSAPLRLGLDDVQELLATGEPTFSLEIGDAAVTVRKQDGGMMASVAVHW